LPAPLDDLGVVKGLLLRHFRWWSDKHDLFNADGTLTIGYTYPNMYMSEDYNSPQSPYWALKSFLALGLPSDHAFWTSQAKQLPRFDSHTITAIRPPMHILCNTEDHQFLLSMGQFCPWPLKATEAKYGKFAYSSHFGFSVPTGTLIQQIAPDSTLALSKDGGDTWRVPWMYSESSFCEVAVWNGEKVAEKLPMLKSKWKPWKDADIEVTTYLVPPSERWPNWYLRVHQFRNSGASEVRLHTMQGGFAIQGRGAERGEILTALTDVQDLATSDGQVFPEGTLQTPGGALICSNAGASGMRPIRLLGAGSSTPIGNERAEVLKPDANTNLIWQRTLIPTIAAEMICSEDEDNGTKKASMLASAVFALARTSDRQERYSALDVGKLWNDVPVLSATAGGDKHPGWYIALD
jgi:hypothetical protein